MNMENFEGINNVSEENVSVSENLAKEGELRRAKNIEEGNKRYLSKYKEVLDEIKDLKTFE